jgi:[ribosomal protein S5]-alanine N-acetyltransferase
VKSYLNVLETKRLVLRWLGPGDATFILQLVNEPAWLRYIGDKGIRTVEDACSYIENGPVAMYHRFGFGLYLIELRESAEPIGICGLIKRESLEEIDLGFALLSAFRGKGFAFEAAAAVMEYGRRTFAIRRLLAITSQDNLVSSRLLEKLGFRVERLTQLEAGSEEVKVFAADFIVAAGL